MATRDKAVPPLLGEKETKAGSFRKLATKATFKLVKALSALVKPRQQVQARQNPYNNNHSMACVPCQFVLFICFYEQPNDNINSKRPTGKAVGNYIVA